MVVSYKNKFIKVFLSSLFLFLISVIGIVWMERMMQDVSNALSDNTFIIIKGVMYLSVAGMVIGYILYFYSHYLFAKAKGYSGWLTLLALINTFGILILFLLPDRRKNNPVL